MKTTNLSLQNTLKQQFLVFFLILIFFIQYLKLIWSRFFLDFKCENLTISLVIIIFNYVEKKNMTHTIDCWNFSVTIENDKPWKNSPGKYVDYFVHVISKTKWWSNILQIIKTCSPWKMQVWGPLSYYMVWLHRYLFTQ